MLIRNLILRVRRARAERILRAVQTEYLRYDSDHEYGETASRWFREEMDTLCHEIRELDKQIG